ncbi:MAG: hypothetical protein ACERK1_07780 [Anaerolineales bacterium]
MKLVTLLTPFLFAVFPVFNLLEYNLGEVFAQDAIRALVISVFLAALLLLICYLIVRSWVKAAIMASILLLAFYSYGHLYNEIKVWNIGGYIIGRHRYLLPAMISIVALIWFGIIRVRDEATLIKILKWMFIASVVLVVIPVFEIGFYHQDELGEMFHAEENEVSVIQPIQMSNAENPDIYYIILDGYTREDILEEHFAYDNSSFIDSLERRGFYVASESNSNYAQTGLSMASSLNMEYVNYISDTEGKSSTNRRLLNEMIASSKTAELLKSLGYRTVSFESGFVSAGFHEPDIFFAPDYSETQQKFALLSGLNLNEFEGILLSTTALRGIFDLYVQGQNEAKGTISDFHHQKHRMRVLQTFSNMETVPDLEGPFLVYAHVISPHPPFIFGPLGEEVEMAGVYTHKDAGCCTKEEYIEGYTDQLSYISKITLLTIDRILVASDPPPIIIIQGDHGPASSLDWQSPTETSIAERVSILNAYYVPEYDQTAFYPSITPVNSFRLLFNTYFGTGYPILEDKIYFSPWSRPYDFVEVTDQVRQ